MQGSYGGGRDSGSGGDLLRGHLPKFVELLKFRSLAVGAKTLAVVVSVTKAGLGLSLPHGLKGHVPSSEVRSPAFTGLEQSWAGRREDCCTVSTGVDRRRAEMVR